MAERPEAREKEVRAAPDRGEGRQPDDFLADGPLGDLELQRAILRADNRIALVAKLVEIAIVRPHVLRKLELPNETCANYERRDAAVDTILSLAVRQLRAIGRAAADHSPAVHVRRSIAWIHAARMGAERDRISVRVHLLVVEVVVSLRISTKLGIVLVGR